MPFQPEIRINSENNEFTFVEYGENVDIFDLNDEEQSLALQYRNKKYTEQVSGLRFHGM